MRWFWIDRFTEFSSGSHAKGIKNVIIEGMAQLGGILVAEHFAFEKHVVLAKVGRAHFLRPARHGDQLHYTVRLDGLQDVGATVTGVSYCDGNLQAEIDLMFAFLEEGRFTSGPLFGPGDLQSMLRVMNFFQVAVEANGRPVKQYPALQANSLGD
jgi:3-hydroxyacyl-[acyl-carrier-protein] dehydratase